MQNNQSNRDAELTKLMQSVMENYKHWLEIDTEYLPLQNLIREAVREYAAASPIKALFVFEGGCGTGITTEHILNASEKIHVVAVDSSPEMVAMTRQRIPSKYNGRWVACVDDFAAGLERITHADVIVSALTIHNLSKEERRELHHLISQKLRPGGYSLTETKL